MYLPLKTMLAHVDVDVVSTDLVTGGNVCTRGGEPFGIAPRFSLILFTEAFFIETIF